MQVIVLCLQIADDALSVRRPALISGRLVNPAEVNPDRIHLSQTTSLLFAASGRLLRPNENEMTTGPRNAGVWFGECSCLDYNGLHNHCANTESKPGKPINT